MWDRLTRQDSFYGGPCDWGECAKTEQGNQKSYSANNIFNSDSRQNFTHEELNYLNNSPPETDFH